MKKRKRKNGRGFITVFVTIIMVPVVAFTGTMVDVARLKLYSSQAAMAADSYGDVVLSEYDNLLKELYGLFAVTQNEEGLNAIKDYAKYINYSFIPNGDGKELEGFMPYKDATVNVDYSVMKNSALSETNIMMSQISEFMKFRVIQSVMDQMDILDSLGKIEGMSSDMDVVKERNEITDESAKALGEIEDYYKILDYIEDYEDYQKDREDNYKKYVAALEEISKSDEYAKYVYYLEHKQEIDDAKARVEAAEKAQNESAEEENTEGDGTEGESEQPSGPSQDDIDAAAKYVDVDAYKAELNQKIDDKLLGSENDKIKFGEAKSKISDLDKKAKDLKKTLQSLSESINSLKAKLATCSDQEFAGKIREEIAELEKISEMKDDFDRTVALLQNNQDGEKDAANKTLWEEKTKQLKEVKESLIAGNGLTGEYSKSIELEWYDFKTDNQAKEFYEQLIKLCAESNKSEKGNKKAADEKKDAAEERAKQAQAEMEDKEPTKARNISDELAKELEGSSSVGEIPDLGDCLSGSAPFSTMGTGMLDKFLVTEYDYGMFSSRVTGIDPDEGDSKEGESTEDEAEEYVDESLTGIEMSKDVNYLYGAELEYLVAGYNKSQSNLDYTRNIICGVRMTTNFMSTYTIDQIDSVISKISTLAADAVAATGIGAAAAPLIKIAVSGALRLTVATVETAGDWKALKERKDVIFYKRKIEELTSYDAIVGFLEDVGEDVAMADAGDESDDGFKMSYEDYVFVLLCLFTDSDTLVSRTANLITLNVNQSQNEGDTLKTLDFKMSDAYTAVKSTCDVNLKFVIVPKNFVDMFIPEDTQAIIQKQDDGAYGYSVIRGY